MEKVVFQVKECIYTCGKKLCTVESWQTYTDDWLLSGSRNSSMKPSWADNVSLK